MPRDDPPKAALTDAAIRALKPAAKRYDVDADGHGLRLRVTPNGVKSFVLRYRFRGTHRRMTLGQYPDLKLAAARKAAAKVRRSVDLGEDPQAAKQDERETMRMVDLLGETGPLVEGKLPKRDSKPGWYLDKHVKTAGRLGTSKTAAAIASDRYRIAKHFRKRQAFMRKPVVDITPADLARIRESVPAGTWRQLRAILHVVFERAVELGLIERNPVKHKSLRAAKPRDMTRSLSAEERERLEAAIAEAEKLGPSVLNGISRSMARLLRLLALTGCRMSEIRLLRWEHVDLTAAKLRLPTSKTGARDVPISPQTVAFLQAEKDRGAATGYVCLSREDMALDAANVERAWRSVRAKAGLGDVRLHDLRHAWASTAVSLGVPTHVVMAVLGHKRSATLDRYAHPHEQAIRSGLEAVGAAIDKATKNLQ